MKKRILTFLCFAGLFCIQSFSQNLNSKRLDSLFDALEINQKVMGNFAVAKNGKVIYTRSIGYSAIDGLDETKATNNTLYRIGSTTKMFTATMIFQLIEEGKISLTSKLDKYFPKIPNSKIISIETLLNHRNGLYDYVNDEKDLSWITKPQSRKIILDEITNGKNHFLPNKKFSYSNSGYYLLACIIEKITGLTYNENLQKRICNILQLKNTYSPADNKLKNNEANSFEFTNNKWDKITDIYFPNVVGVGDILSTTSDLIQFNDALLDGKLISKKSLSFMKTFANNTFGMGIMRIPFYKRIGYGHGGDTYGTHTIVAKFLEDSLTIASCINGEVFSSNDISIGILSICYNEKYEIPTFKIFKVTSELLKKYIGEYSSKEMPLKISIKQENENLYAKATGQSTFPLEATEKDKFSFVQAGIIIEFNTERSELTLKQGGGSYLFVREK